MQDTLQRTQQWFIEAVREPTDRNKVIQVGIHVEEFGEMMEAIGDQGLAKRMQGIASEYKRGDIEYSKLVINRQELLDSLADQIVTAVGVAYMFDMDIVGALNEVNRSNYSKFVDGRAVFDENGKIKKGPDYSKPDLTKFV
jgi:hypothetical protein